jgi:hypothetical protein
MEFLLIASYSLIFVFLIYKWDFFAIDEITRKSLAGVFLLKVLLGFILAGIYTYFYTDRLNADIYKYFDDSAILYQVFKTNPKHFFQIMIGMDAEYLHPYYKPMNFWFNQFNFYNDNQTMIKFNALLRFVSFGYYSIHSIFVCFLSMVGLTGFMKVFHAVMKDKGRLLFAGVYLLPSVLFWLSGVLKDGLLIFAFGVLFYNFFKMITHRFSMKTLLLCVCMFYLLTILKLYILLILVPGMIAWYWAYATRLKRIGLKFAFVYLVSMIALFNMEMVLPKYNFKDYLAHKQRNFLGTPGMRQSGSFIEIKPIDASGISILSAAPAAFFTILTRPCLFEARSPFIIMAALENTIILFLIIICLFSFHPKKIQEPLFYFSIYFFSLLFVLIGLVTPVMGAFVRYKVPGLLFLMVILIFIYDKEILIKRFPFFKRYSGYL